MNSTPKAVETVRPSQGEHPPPSTGLPEQRHSSQEPSGRPHVTTVLVAARRVIVQPMTVRLIALGVGSVLQVESAEI